MKIMKLAACIAIFSLCLCASAVADTLVFDLSPTNNTTSRGPGDGPGQGVSVSTTQTIDNFAFNLSGSAQSLDFFVFNGTNSTLLYNSTQAWGGGSGWVQTSSPFTLTLTAGNTYYFGIMGNGNLQIGYIFPQGVYSANGLTALTNGNSNYNTFGNPQFAGLAGAQIGLQIFENVNETPEPGSLILLGSGLIGVAGGIRRKLIA
jgi:hypothetical protein